MFRLFNEATTEKEAPLILDRNYLLPEENIVNPPEIEIVGTELLTTDDTALNLTSALLEKIQNVQEEVLAVRKEQIKVTSYLDKIYKILVDKEFPRVVEKQKEDDSQSKIAKYSFPLKTVKEIIDFDRDISNDADLLSVMV